MDYYFVNEEEKTQFNKATEQLDTEGRKFLLTVMKDRAEVKKGLARYLRPHYYYESTDGYQIAYKGELTIEERKRSLANALEVLKNDIQTRINKNKSLLMDKNKNKDQHQQTSQQPTYPSKDLPENRKDKSANLNPTLKQQQPTTKETTNIKTSTPIKDKTIQLDGRKTTEKQQNQVQEKKRKAIDDISHISPKRSSPLTVLKEKKEVKEKETPQNKPSTSAIREGEETPSPIKRLREDNISKPEDICPEIVLANLKKEKITPEIEADKISIEMINDLYEAYKSAKRNHLGNNTIRNYGKRMALIKKTLKNAGLELYGKNYLNHLNNYNIRRFHRCNICKLPYKNEKELNDHLKAKHGTNKTKRHCQYLLYKEEAIDLMNMAGNTYKVKRK